jgi:urease accessory protein
MKYTRTLIVAAFALAPTLAHAHPGHAGHDDGGIGWGLLHPLTGLDHLLAMIAVGLWAVQLGGRALWLLPTAFLGAMTLGGAFGLAGAQLPFVEPMILASVLVLGALIAFAARLPLGLSAGIVALGAFFHGQAHGAEMSAGAGAWFAALGVLLATALLHGAGIGAGLTLQRVSRSRALRFAGATILVAAVLLVAGVV